ncbi:acyl-CoA N-acyltransferase [Xylariaceae sp. FL0804]|nr:acyl-CoA N-acyltransferase [Xylariaceae sp. FL0804]
MAAASPFTLSRMAPDDMLEMIDVEYDCFPDFVRSIFMGCPSKADIPRLADHEKEDMKNDPHIVWLKLVDNSSGRIVAGSQWKVFPSHAPDSSDDTPAPWLEGDKRERALVVMRGFNEKRRKANPQGFVHLHICFTHPDFRRRGAGAMMLKWGCDLADGLFLPAWVEASEEGNFLYKAFGFYNYEKIEDEGLGGGMNMRREPLVRSVQGGKPV